MEERDEIDADTTESKEAWHRHPITIQKAKDYRSQAEKKLQVLLNVCKESDDPKVVRALCEYEKPEIFAKLLKGSL